MVELNQISFRVFSIVLEFIYTEQVTELPPDIVLDIFEAADQFLLPNLKSLCIAVMAHHIEESNVFDLIRMSKIFVSDRLEQACIEYLSAHLEELIHTEEFINLVKESAASIQVRAENDSIPIIDDIRNYLDRVSLALFFVFVLFCFVAHRNGSFFEAIQLLGGWRRRLRS